MTIFGTTHRHAGERTPSHLAMTFNANILARFATCCQQAGLVPLVQAEVLAEGTHCIGRAEQVAEEVRKKKR